MKLFLSGFLALVLCLVLATAAFGQSSVQGYSNEAGQIQAQVDQGTDSATQPVATTTSGDGGGSLPFTGLDVALFVGAGGLLVVAGLAMRRLTRAPGSA